MATIDNIVKNVGKFDAESGDIKKSRRDYERAKQGAETIGEYRTVLEDMLKKETGYNKFNLPSEPQDFAITQGDVTFNVRSEATTKRPKYKEAVTQMENYLGGLSYVLSEGRIITGVAKEEGKWVIGVDELLMQYTVMVAGIMVPDVRHKISYDASGKIATEKTLESMNLGDIKDIGLNEASFMNYIRMERLEYDLVPFVKSYEKKLSESEKTKGIVGVNSRAGYKKEDSKAEGTSWKYVASTLIKIKEDDDDGELDILANPDISLTEKKEDLPFYELFVREPYGEKKLYVSLESVYDRIQDLKGQQKIVTEKTKYTSIDIV